MGEEIGSEEKWEGLEGGESSCAVLVELQHFVRSSETKLQAGSRLQAAGSKRDQAAGRLP